MKCPKCKLEMRRVSRPGVALEVYCCFNCGYAKETQNDSKASCRCEAEHKEGSGKQN